MNSSPDLTERAAVSPAAQRILADRPERFLLVSGDFVRTGGMDNGNYGLAEFLARAGNEVHLVAFRVAEPLASLRNVIWHRVPKPLRSYTLALPLLDHYGRYYARRIAARGGRVVVNGGCCWWGDVNWVHYVHAAHQPQVLSSRIRHGITRYNHTRWLREEKRALDHARLIIANSDRTRRDLIERVGVPAARVQTLYYGTDPTRFRPADDSERLTLRDRLGWHPARPMALFIGAVSDRRKGFDTLFEAWKELCGQPGWDVDLAVVGTGAELPAWQRRTSEAGMAKRIRFLGFRRDVDALLRAADLLVAPTRYEAYGLGVHEALCCSLPAVVSAIAGVAERYPENIQDLLLTDPEDSRELSIRLKQWYDNRERFRHAVAPLSEQLRQWTWERMAERFVEAMHNTK